MNKWNYVDMALACVIVDNVVSQGQLARDTDDPRTMGARRVVENIGKDDRLDSVVVQTVGDKELRWLLDCHSKVVGTSSALGLIQRSRMRGRTKTIAGSARPKSSVVQRAVDCTKGSLEPRHFPFTSCERCAPFSSICCYA